MCIVHGRVTNYCIILLDNNGQAVAYSFTIHYDLCMIEEESIIENMDKVISRFDNAERKHMAQHREIKQSSKANRGSGRSSKENILWTKVSTI